jgi:hypothetical protein
VDVLVEVLGWTGAVLVLCAYLLAARDIWPASTFKSAAANVTGAGLLAVNALHHEASPSVALNVVWAGIAVAALARATGRDAAARRST